MICLLNRMKMSIFAEKNKNVRRSMCKISETTILNANRRMKGYKVGRESRMDGKTDKISVSTRVLGKTYNRSFSMGQVNEAFARALMNTRDTHGQRAI